MSMHVTSTASTYIPPPIQEVQQPRERYKSTLNKLGITEVILGIVFIISSIVSLFLVPIDIYQYRYVFFVTSGIWCGVFPIVSGGLGICSQQRPTSCMYVANMVMSIFTALAMVSMIGVSSVAVIIFANIGVAFVLQIACAVGGFIVFVVAIVHSAYCCAGVCCAGSLAYAPPVPSQQLIQLPNGQFAPVQAYSLAFTQGYSTPVISASPLAVQPPSGYVTPGSSTCQYPPQAQFNEGQSASANPPPYGYYANVK